MQSITLIDKKTLDQMVKEHLLTNRDGEPLYTYESKHGYLTDYWTPGDELVSLEQESIRSHRVDHRISTFVDQANDMLEFYSVCVRLHTLADNQWRSPELDKQITKVAKSTRASESLLSEIAKNYYNFTHYGFPVWEHRSMAKVFGISVQTLKKYLKDLNIYDSSKHRGREKIE